MNSQVFLNVLAENLVKGSDELKTTPWPKQKEEQNKQVVLFNSGLNLNNNSYKI